MQFEVKESGKLKKSLNITVSEEKLSDMRSSIVNQFVKESNIPGFRKGKAPKEMVEKKHAALIKEELLKQAVPQYYRDALQESKVEPVSYPQFKDVEIKDGNLSFSAEFETKPEIVIDEKVYGKIKLKLDSLDVNDDDVEKFIETLKEQLAASIEKEKDDLDLAFVAKWSGYQDVDEFKAAIRSELHLNKVVERRRSIEKQITDTLMEKVKFDLPQSVLDEQKQRLIYQQRQNLAQRGIAKEDLQKHYDEIEQGAAKLAEEQVKMFYLLEAVALKEELKYNQNNLMEVVLGTILTKILG